MARPCSIDFVSVLEISPPVLGMDPIFDWERERTDGRQTGRCDGTGASGASIGADLTRAGLDVTFIA